MDARDHIPQYKLAKVGRRRNKAAAAGLLGLFGGGGSSAGGVAGFLGSIGGKVAIALLVGTLGTGAYNMGKVLAPPQAQQAKAESEKPKPFAAVLAQKKKEEAAQTIQSDNRSVQSGLAMVSGSLDGLTDEERAALAKEEAAKAKAAAEAKAKEDAQASQAQAAPQMPNPADMLAAAAGQDKDKGREKGLGKKFGEMSKSLAGGGGMAGGMGRGFDTPAFKGGGGAGKLVAMTGNRAPSTYASAHSAIAAGKGHLARDQAVKAYHESRQAKISGANETSSEHALAAFNGKTTEGGLIGGPGMRLGAAQTGEGEKFTPNPLGPGSMGGGSSGAESTGPDDCKALFPDGYYMNSPSGGCVQMPGSSVDPTDKYFNLLKILSIVAACLTAIIFVLSFWPHLKPVVKFLSWIVCAIGSMEAFLGLMLVGMGRNIEGGIFTGLGIGTAIAGYLCATSEAAGAAKAEGILSQTQAWATAAGTSLAQTLAVGYANNPSKGHYNPDSEAWKYK